MSLSDYLNQPVVPYTETNSGTHIMPEITWTAGSTIYVYWETADGRQAVTSTEQDIRADINMICNTSDVIDYNARYLFGDGEIYKIVFIDTDPANRGSHQEILLKRMPAGTAADMGIS